MLQILGMAIGMAPKDKTFKAYIELELQLGNIDRCVCGKCTPELTGLHWNHSWHGLLGD